MPIPGIDIVGPLPAELQTVLFCATGIATMAKQPDAAKALVKFISTEAAVPVIRKNGVDPCWGRAAIFRSSSAALNGPVPHENSS
jgi:molybdate transport system substrate-binding protein